MLESARKRPSTVRVYTLVAESLMTGPSERLPQRMAEEFGRLQNSVARGRIGTASGNVTIAALNAFAGYLREQGMVTPDRFPAFRVVRHTYEPLTPTEVDGLLRAPGAIDTPPLILARDTALIGILCGSELRVSQIAALQRSNVTSLSWSNHARYWIRVYLGRRRDALPALFLRHDRAGRGDPRPLTPRSIERIVVRYGQVAHIADPVTPERIRATVRAVER